MDIKECALELAGNLLARLREYTLNDDYGIVYYHLPGDLQSEYFSEGAQNVVRLHDNGCRVTMNKDTPCSWECPAISFKVDGLERQTPFVREEIADVILANCTTEMQSYLALPEQETTTDWYLTWQPMQDTVFRSIGPGLGLSGAIIKELVDDEED
jgi:hypothetical protein